MNKKKVVIGFIGSQLDAGQGAGRWEKWRPTVSLAQHEDTLIDRIELFYSRRFTTLAHILQDDIARASPQTQVNRVLMDVANPWDFGEMYAALYDWARDYPFNPEQEEYWAHITTGTHVAQICLFLMVESRQIPGVLLQTAPPKKHRQGDAGHYALIDLDLSRYNVLAQRFDNAHHDALDFLKSGIATRNARFNALIEEIERVAVRSQMPVLLTGPTGAGKSHLARRMYALKKARHQVEGDFIEVNCATLRGDSASSTLFGHKKGAFTGAAAERAGLLRAAHKGVLFLDEIGELGADEQAMLLKAVEEKRFFPMGSDKEVSSDFQLVAGTNRDLRLDVAQGRFREDLFARINIWVYTLPSLAQRPEDIEPNLEYLLAQINAQTGTHVRFNSEAKAAYLAFAKSAQALWRGNFRDLLSSITRMATLAHEARITTDLVAAEIERLLWLWQPVGKTTPTAGAECDLAELLGHEAAAQIDLFDRVQLQAVIGVCQQASSLSDAGRTLFAHSRTQRAVVNDSDRLRKYLQKHGLTWEMVQAQALN